MKNRAGPHSCWHRTVTVGIVTLFLYASRPTDAAPLPPDDLTKLSLDELMNVTVTSVSRKEQKLSAVAAAIFVITAEDIRRSGMNTIPELLRMVPGVNVARITANTWAISVRGFTDQYAGKVLVLIDGRSVYTQEFSGVFWDQQSVPVEEIDRIEVIRGPGGTVWGANAVNGVINIITKKTEATQGGLLTLASGNQDSARGYARYGGKVGEKLSYRFYGSYFNIENSPLGIKPDSSVPESADGWHGSQFGFRTEAKLTPRDLLTVEGDMFASGQGQTATVIQPQAGYLTRTVNTYLAADTANILGRWEHAFSNGSAAALQVFHSDAKRRGDVANDDQRTSDVDFQYHFQLGTRQDMVTGFNYRRASLNFEGFAGVRYPSPTLSSNLFSGFLQDEIHLSPSVALTLGSKFEHNSFTAFEFEPAAQLAWEATAKQTLWVSVARAIQQPSWVFSAATVDGATFPTDGGGLGVYRLLGNSNLLATSLIDFSAGYRRRVHSDLTLDVSVFRSYYHQLQTTETGTPFEESTPDPPHLVVPAIFENKAHGRNYGFETSVIWQAAKRWRLTPGYSFLQMKVTPDPSSNDATTGGTGGNSPKHQIKLRSSLDLPKRFEWDISAFYTSGLNPELGLGNQSPVAGYTRLDSRLGWHFAESLEFSLTGQNLLSRRRFEFPNSELQLATPVPRAVVAKIAWRFR